jgi:hypothetical protein
MAGDETIDASTVVDQILTWAGLSVPLEDRTALVEMYPDIRRMVQRLRIPEAASTNPALVYISDDFGRGSVRPAFDDERDDR